MKTKSQAVRGKSRHLGVETGIDFGGRVAIERRASQLCPRILDNEDLDFVVFLNTGDWFSCQRAPSGAKDLPGVLPLGVFKFVQTPFSCWHSIGNGGVHCLTIQ